MLKVDLGLLARKKRFQIDRKVAAEDPLLAGTGLELSAPLEVHLDAQQAGQDVVVRGELSGEAELACRRCLRRVRHPFAEEVSFLYRAGVSPVDAEAQEIYALPERSSELDLSQAVREHLVLAIPQFALCDQACRGLCPQCGANLNEITCHCQTVEADERWAALRKIKNADQV